MASSLSVGLPHQEVSSQLPLDSCLTPAVQTIRDVPTEGGLTRTDPPSPRALPALASKGIYGGSFSDSRAWTGPETSTLTQGGREARGCGVPQPLPSPMSPSPLWWSPLYPARVSLLWGLGETGRGHHALPSSTTSLSSGHHAAMATARPPQEEALTSRSMGSAPEGSSSAWGLREEGAKERQDPLPSEGTSVASKRKEATL